MSCLFIELGPNLLFMFICTNLRRLKDNPCSFKGSVGEPSHLFEMRFDLKIGLNLAKKSFVQNSILKQLLLLWLVVFLYQRATCGLSLYQVTVFLAFGLA